MLMSRLFVFGALLGIATLLAGCGGGSTVPELAPVSGTVSIDGTPAAGVTVSFNPSGATKTTGGIGVTGPDGKYKMMHRSGELGIEPGSYTVTFSRMMQPDGTPLPPGTNPLDVAAEESIPPNIVQQADVPAAGGTFDFTIDVPKGKK